MRHKVARIKAARKQNRPAQKEVCLPVEEAEAIVNQLNEQRRWAGMVIDAADDFEAIMDNPDWLITDKAKRIELIIGTLHSRLLNLRKHLI